jgi:hypothetical protein
MLDTILHEKLADANWRLYFHGTGAAFDRFDESHIGEGPDANCALGVFVTDSPLCAAHYAENVAATPNDARVLLVLLNQTHEHEIQTYRDFYGCDLEDGGNPEHDRAHFVRLRAELAQRYTVAWFTLDDDGLIGVVLKPEDALIVGSISAQAARALADEDLPFASNAALLTRALELSAHYSTVKGSRPL